jgi:membrane-associated protein
MVNLIDIFLHLNRYLGEIIQTYGGYTYLILFLIIFSETGLVFFTFFPGDTLLFVAGAFAAMGAINIFLLFFILAFAAIIGDSVNYVIGKYFGLYLIRKKWVREESVIKTREFFHKHGGKTIIFARFIPLIRSFAPFIAGISEMNYLKFFAFNVVGSILWVASMLALGYFFGSVPFVKNNFSWMIIVIVVLSYIPVFIAFLTGRKNRQK